MSYWSNFREKLTYYLFGPNLEEGEKILFVSHRHPFVLVKSSIKISFLHFFLPIFLWYVFPEIWFVFLVWLVYGGIAFTKMMFDWYFDALVITDKCLLSVTWNGPFDRNSTRLDYSMVEGTSYNFKGIWQTIFNFGTITVNRQGGGTGMELKDAINPTRVESMVLGYQEKYLDNKNMDDVKALKSLLSEMIKKHTKEMKEIEVDIQ